MLHRDRLTEQIERLAHHALQGKLRERAVRYLWLAGGRRPRGSNSATSCRLTPVEVQPQPAPAFLAGASVIAMGTILSVRHRTICTSGPPIDACLCSLPWCARTLGLAAVLLTPSRNAQGSCMLPPQHHPTDSLHE